LLLSLASFSLNKVHALIIGISYLIIIVIFSLIIENQFLYESLPLILVVIAAYTGLTYYLVNLFEKALLFGQSVIQQIRTQNLELNNVNALLEEKQQIIEEQSSKLEEQSLQLQAKNLELTQLNESKNRFFSIIAHDLKNPFNQILGFVTFLRDKFSILPEEKKIHYLGLIESTSLKTYSLLENLLNWSRSQTHNIKINPGNINLNDIIIDIQNLYSERIRAKSLDIVFVPEKKFEAYADKDMLATVIRNLFSNAVKFSNPEGKLLSV
jgi:signal transduction histidine kinase